MIFSIWLGDRPPELERKCMAENNRIHSLTLIASQNWIGADKFIRIEPVLDECLLNSDCRELHKKWNSFENVSEILRLWWLMQHPNETYVDSDCILLNQLEPSKKIQVPSCHASALALTAAHGVELDVDLLRNSVKSFVEVYVIAGGGDSSQFALWLKRWSKFYSVPGGIAETICYEPFDLDIISDTCFKHFPEAKCRTWKYI